jgi:hypothetical protein
VKRKLALFLVVVATGMQNSVAATTTSLAAPGSNQSSLGWLKTNLGLVLRMQ